MECHQAAALVLLYLACCTLVPTTNAVGVKYTGETYVRENTKEWNITCELPNSAEIIWRRNNQFIPEVNSGIISVEKAVPLGNGNKLSVLKSTEGVQSSYEGEYTCTDGSNETFHFYISYDVQIMVLAPKNDTLQLTCPDNRDYEWTKETEPGEGPKKLDTDSNQYSYENDGTLTISTVSNSNAKQADVLYGNYTCTAGNETNKYRVVRKPIVKMEEFQNVVEEEKMHLTCIVTNAEPGIMLKWGFKNKNYTGPDGRVKLSKDVEKNLNNAVLTLEDIEMDDRGDIICYAFYNRNDLDNPNRYGMDKTFLRVKDKYAALWPFLGICAEVAILCIIILIYEKKRNKSEMEESDTDQSPDTKPTPNKDSDVRQRK